MATKRTRKQAVLFKVETVYGSDAGPTGGANAMLVTNLQIVPMEGGTVSRDLVRPYLGNDQQIPVNTHVSVSFDVEMSGSGVAGTPPAYGVMLRACGLAETAVTGLATIANSPPVDVGTPAGSFTFVKTAAFTGTQPRDVTLTCTTAGGSGIAQFTVSAPAAGNLDAYNQAGVVMTDAVAFDLGGGAQITPTVTAPFQVGDEFTIALTAPRVEYDPVSDGFEAGTLYVNKDGNLHALLGSRGTVQMKLEANQLPKWSFTFKGLWVDPSAAPLPSTDTSAFKAPIAVSATNTPELTLHGVSSPAQSLTINFDNQVEFFNRIAKEAMEIADRKPKGSIVIEDPGVDVKNYFLAAKSADMGALRLVHGIEPGGIVQVDGPQAQVFNPRYSDDRGVQMLTMDLSLVPTDAGDDEVKITVK